MRPIRLTVTEARVIRDALKAWTGFLSTSEADEKAAARVLTKLAESELPAATVAVAPIEAALVAASRGKVVPLGDPRSYQHASRTAARVEATPEKAAAIGAWIARQPWFRGQATILLVLKKWGEWLPPALKSLPPREAKEGFGGGTDEPAPGPTGPGFGDS